jgi:hypothetical protein
MARHAVVNDTNGKFRLDVSAVLETGRDSFFTPF